MPPADPSKINNPERLAKLHSLNLLNLPDDPSFDRLTRLASRVLHAPIALLSFVDGEHQHFVSQVGLKESLARARRSPWQESFCQHVVATNEPLVVEDARHHALVCDNPLIDQYQMVAYAGVPLTTNDGHTLGTFCVIDTQPRRWTDDELEILRELSHAVIREIDLRSEIKDRRRIEAALGESEHFVQRILQTFPDIVYILDVNRIQFVYYNHDILKFLGYDDKRFEEDIAPDITQLIHPEDFPKLIQYMMRLQTGGDAEVSEVKFRMRHANGGWVWTHQRGVVFKRAPNGSVEQILVLGQNITERKQMEEALQDTLERMVALRGIEAELGHSLDLASVLQISADILQRITGAKDGFIGLFNGDQIEAVHTIGRYERGRLFERTAGIIGRVLSSGEAELVADVTADPDYIAYISDTRSMMCMPLTYRERLIGIVNLETPEANRFTREAFEFVRLLVGQIALSIDNAQLYEVAQQQLQELAHLYARVSELEQLKTDVIRIAAHDLRNPLTHIIGYTDLLLEAAYNLDADQLEFLQSIQNASRKMERLINDILSLQRIEALNKSTLEALDLAEVVRDVFAENRKKALEKAQHFVLNVLDTAVNVKGDLIQICEAIDNLIGNAIKYTPQGGTITVRLYVDGSAHNRAVFEVEDNGIGVPAEQQANLFQPFFRAKTSETAKIEGTGLGLHLVKNIIERHHGQMRFHSELGQGSTFGFELPTT